jgi:hypothetical protein
MTTEQSDPSKSRPHVRRASERFRTDTDAYQLFDDIWNAHTGRLDTPDIVRPHLRRLRSAVGRSFRLVIGKPTQPLGDFLPVELLRIYTETLRRMYQAMHAGEVRAVSLLNDNTRVLLELQFQVFYLLESTDAESAARTAFLLSCRDAVDNPMYELPGATSLDNVTPEERDSYLWLGAQLRSIAPRPPRAYAGLGVRRVAVEAKLQGLYDALYRRLSQPTHSTPINEHRVHSVMWTGKVLPLLVPSEDSLAAIPFLLTACAAIGSLTCIAAAAVLYSLRRTTLEAAIRHASRTSLIQFQELWARQTELVRHWHAHPQHPPMDLDDRSVRAPEASLHSTTTVPSSEGPSSPE